MPIPGPVASQQIQNAYRQAQQALADARAQASATGQSIQALAADRDHTLEDLAEYYLPELSRESLMQVWGEAKRGIEHILLRQEEHVARVENQLETQDRERESKSTKLAESNERLDALLQQQQTLSEQLAKLLAGDAQFKALSDRAAEAEAALERAEASLAEIEHDATQKLPAYEKSKLFMYLWKRGLATPRYTARGFTRRMDRWVGGLIDYPKAKAGYEYLKNTPQLVRNLVSKDRESLNVVMSELERQRDTQAEKIGLTQVVEQVNDADRLHHEILSALEALQQLLDATRKQLSEIENPRGIYYQEAINYFKSLLQKTEQEKLRDRAEQTPDPRDDQIVARLQHLEGQFRTVNTEAAARQQRIDWLDRHLSELGNFHQRFRAAGYDSSRSMFDDSLNLTHELTAAMDGNDSIDSVWQRMRGRQRFGPSAIDSAGSALSRAASHPLTQVLVYAMANAASEALSDHARRAGGRRTSSHSGGSVRSTGGGFSIGGGQSSSSSRSSGRSGSGGGIYTDNKI